jgi:hypothetical protein
LLFIKQGSLPKRTQTMQGHSSITMTFDELQQGVVGDLGSLRR